MYYSGYQAFVRGQRAGDTVSYKIKVGKSTYGPYSYSVNSATGNPILVVAAENYTGPYNRPGYDDTTAPNYLQYYTAALDAGGYAYDVWDLDAQGVPTYAEVLSHYDVAVWYTGNNFAPRVAPLNLDTLEAEVLNFRDFINYRDGKLFATGQDLSRLVTYYGWFSDDFFQYYLGAYLHIEGAGMGSDGPIDVIGQAGDPIFDGLTFSIQGGDGADNQGYADSFAATGFFLPDYSQVVAASSRYRNLLH